MPALGRRNTLLAGAGILHFRLCHFPFATFSILWPAVMFYESEQKKWQMGLAGIQSSRAYLLNLFPGRRTFNSHFVM